MITIKNLSKVYNGNVHALRDIDLNIDQGMFGLLGPNGAGKTTLMRIIAGLLRPTHGSVDVFGYDVRENKGKQQIKALLGYLPQELGMYPELTAREFLNYIGILKGITDSKARQLQVDELLNLVRLQDVANRRIGTLSGGMKRRVGIAQAMLGNPKLLIVDEPTVGLDPEERVRIRNILSDMALRCTVILSTHVIEDISHTCHDLAIIDKGGVLFSGAPSDLISEARGKVWSIRTSGDYLASDLQVVSTLQLADSIQYRVLGVPDATYDAQPLEPSLEDGYMLMMHRTS
ncbi:MAG: ABC transporter ATP-binding protein [Anaerolineae bacterium]